LHDPPNGKRPTTGQLCDALRVSTAGVQLCTCSQKKIDWYIKRGIATLESGCEAPTIRLRFEPNGRTHAADQYYLADKANHCAVCGDTKQYLRHRCSPQINAIASFVLTTAEATHGGRGPPLDCLARLHCLDCSCADWLWLVDTHTHSVVPPCYRQHFPDAMKSHLSHDIVLLCVPCKQTVNTAVHARMVRSWFGGFF
jgi:hypothetical protein